MVLRLMLGRARLEHVAEKCRGILDCGLFRVVGGGVALTDIAGLGTLECLRRAVLVRRA